MYNKEAMQDLSEAIVDFNKWYQRDVARIKKIATPLSELLHVLKSNDFRLTFRVILGNYRLTWKQACYNECCSCPNCIEGFDFFIENLESAREPLSFEKFYDYEPDFHINNFISKNIDTIQARIYSVIEEVRTLYRIDHEEENSRANSESHAQRAMAVLSGDLPLDEL